MSPRVSAFGWHLAFTWHSGLGIYMNVHPLTGARDPCAHRAVVPVDATWIPAIGVVLVSCFVLVSRVRPGTRGTAALAHKLRGLTAASGPARTCAWAMGVRICSA